ncbi:MAG: sigma 54-interacting transcriptional regulator [Nitrospinae bacterium]|nr:sigma 54-interacting transcriptional regulator [Nitrospinota bacterium]
MNTTQSLRSGDGGLAAAALNGIQDSIKIVDRAFNLIYANAEALKDAARPADEVMAHPGKCFETFFQSRAQCSFCVIDKVFETGQPVFNIFHPSEEAPSAVREISAFPLTGETGKVEYVIEIVRDVTRLTTELVKDHEFSGIISKNEKMAQVFELIKAVAAANSTVLITGETGTGKELIARAIHRNSRRSERRMVSVNCGALPETLLESELFGYEKGAFTGAGERRIGVFEQAHKGTLFLDEIGSISQNMQVKILRALQEGEITRVGGSEPVRVDVRIICAANVNLEDMVRRGEFRDDLYYRVNVVPILLPPLRDRGEDIHLLAEHYLKRFCEETGKALQGFTANAIAQMNRYRWPGNVRELKNLVERAVILSRGQFVEKLDIGSPIEPLQPASPESARSLKEAAETAERRYLISVLRQTRGAITAAAEAAGVNARTIHRKMREFNIGKEEFK